MPKFGTPLSIFNAIIKFITISSSYNLQPYAYQSAEQLQCRIHDFYRWFWNLKFWRHNQDTMPPTYIAISSVNPKIITQFNQSFNMNIIYSLFVIQFLLNIRHRVSNKNEFVHSILKAMCKLYGKNSIDFCLLLVLIFIFHANFCIINSLSTSQHYYYDNLYFISWLNNLYEFYSTILEFKNIFNYGHQHNFQIIRFFYQSHSFTTTDVIAKKMLKSPLKWTAKHETLLCDYVAYCRDLNISLTNNSPQILAKLPIFRQIPTKIITQKLDLYVFMYILIFFNIFLY